ncbi:MAG: o-succinylbenzoate--CoA ligase [Rubrobacter sp.]
MNPDLPSVPCPLHAAALTSPETPAVLGATGAISYAELDRRVSVAAYRLGELGLGAGRRTALYLPKDESYLVLLLALVRAGGVACPLSTRIPPESIVPLLRRAACSALVSDDERAIEVAESVRKLEPETLVESMQDSSRLPETRKIPLDRPSTIVFTSGSTGVPKAALHTFGNHYYSALGSNANIALSRGDRWLHSLPLYHVGGLSILFRCLLAGATVALPQPGRSPGDAIAALGATHVSLVPTQLLRLLREDAALDGVRAILLGGGPIPAYLVDEALARGLPIHTSYGLTEMASQVTTTPQGAAPEELSTAGRVLPHRGVIVSGRGEILVRGETLFAGYVEGEVVDRPLDACGWFHTGDLGDLDEGGYLRVRGREDNTFFSGGENVQPEEIEEALCRIEGVEEAVVVPVEDEEFGQRPVAFVRVAGGTPEPEALSRALGASLARFKIPVSFHAWPDDARGMKVDRTAFGERARRLGREG